MPGYALLPTIFHYPARTGKMEVRTNLSICATFYRRLYIYSAIERDERARAGEKSTSETNIKVHGTLAQSDAAGMCVRVRARVRHA